MEHTPGPWEVEVTESTIETSVCGPIKMRYKRTLNVSNEDRERNMADMEAEAMANARLIAAAPDLLAACALLIGRLKHLEPYLEYQTVQTACNRDAIAIGEAAIAKATTP
ncbi:hypothetical protein LCGC14_1627040 [marine sediment metagenome]|uniref:Uncharacterized protein n=1 Tax=marine sediment metagenome TaxID=412755 RepID=A0A0F9I3S4_9ZZZZ